MGNKEKLEKARKERLGSINISNEGYEMKIIEYNGVRNIIIEFQDEYKAKITTNYQCFKDGNVKNPFHKSLYGVGYYGVGKYKSRDNNQESIIYKYWRSMINRCYNPYYINKELSYIDCYVCEEWHNFQNFAKWYEENYYEVLNEVMQLDKDILIKGNKIYSPSTCIFVPQRINSLFLKCDKVRGEYPIGVSLKKANSKDRTINDKLKVNCSIREDNKTKRKFLGYFPINKPFQAFTCYKTFKEKYIKQVADEYKDLIPQKLYEAMYKYEVEIND